VKIKRYIYMHAHMKLCGHGMRKSLDPQALLGLASCFNVARAGGALKLGRIVRVEATYNVNDT
jgi:hypothetical protein